MVPAPDVSVKWNFSMNIELNGEVLSLEAWSFQSSDFVFAGNLEK